MKASQVMCLPLMHSIAHFDDLSCVPPCSGHSDSDHYRLDARTRQAQDSNVTLGRLSMIAALIGAFGVIPGAEQGTSLSEVLARAGTYVEEFQRQLSGI